MVQFHETAMGRVFFERHIPRIATALERIADLLELDDDGPDFPYSPDPEEPEPEPRDLDPEEEQQTIHYIGDGESGHDLAHDLRLFPCEQELGR